MTAEDIRPFLSTVPTPTRPLAAVLPALVTREVLSPWSPRAAAAFPAAPSAAELAAVFDDARARGHAEGLAQTAALRDRLTGLLGELAAARAATVTPTAEVIAEIATCVVETWVGSRPPSAMFAPIIHGWLVQSDSQATVRVHPDDAAALAEAIGAAPLTIAGDPALARGALEIRGAALELSHDWSAHLADLRAAIVAALTGVES